MKRWMKTVLPAFVLAFILLIPGMQVQAGTISSVKATPGTNQITVSGIAEDDVLSVAIFIYDSTETTLLQMESVAVDSNHAYRDTISVPDGTYVVKVADYEGGAFAETNVTVSSASAGNQKDNVPNTGDTNAAGCWFALAILGGAGAIYLGIKKTMKYE